VDTYEWLPGRFALLHKVDARVGEAQVAGAEIIGWDPARGAYVTQDFGSDGPNTYEASLAEENGALMWSTRSHSDRFEGTFSDDGSSIDGHWEQLDETGNWQPWMEITLTRQQADSWRARSAGVGRLMSGSANGTAASMSARRPSCFATASSSPTGAGRATSAGCSAAPWSRYPRPIPRSPAREGHPPRPGRGHGGGRQSRQEFWVWPLRPPGPVAFVCEWPRYGIPESRVKVEAASIRAAASKAMEIWPAPG
jgi:hypothetical protein